MQDVFEPMNFDGDYSNFYPVNRNVDGEIGNCATRKCAEDYARNLSKTNKELAKKYTYGLTQQKEIREDAFKDVVKNLSSNDIKEARLDDPRYNTWKLENSILKYFRKYEKPYILDVSKYTIFKDVNKYYHPFNNLLHRLAKDTENVNYKVVKKTPELIFTGIDYTYKTPRNYNRKDFNVEFNQEFNFDGSAKEEKFLGMPRKVGIGVTIGIGVLAVAGIIFAIVKKKK